MPVCIRGAQMNDFRSVTLCICAGASSIVRGAGEARTGQGEGGA